MQKSLLQKNVVISLPVTRSRSSRRAEALKYVADIKESRMPRAIAMPVAKGSVFWSSRLSLRWISCSSRYRIFVTNERSSKIFTELFLLPSFSSSLTSFTVSSSSKSMDLMLRAPMTISLSANTGSSLSGGLDERRIQVLHLLTFTALRSALFSGEPSSSDIFGRFLNRGHSLSNTHN